MTSRLGEIRDRIAVRRLLVFLTCAGGLTILFLGLAGTGPEGAALIRDPLASAEVAVRDPGADVTIAPWTGFLSMLGVMAWSAGAAICAFAGLVLRSRREDRARASFLLATAVVLGVLGLDDAFQFHEAIAPFELSIPEKFVYLGLLAGLAGWLWAFRRQILSSELGLLGVAFCGLGLSTGIDVLVQIRPPVEDSLKLTGIAAFVLWASAESFAGVVHRDRERVEWPVLPEAERSQHHKRGQDAAGEPSRAAR